MSSIIPAKTSPSKAAANKDCILTGRLHARVYEILHGMNPSFIFCNCSVIAYKLAHLLEKGSIPPMSFLASYLPQPMNGECIILKWPNLFGHLGLRRSYVHVVDVNVAMVNLMMRSHGKGAHAIVAGYYKNPLLFNQVGHCWNYVFEDEGKFIILDGYSRSYQHLGQKNPEKYLAKFKESLEAIIFFNTKQR